MNQWITQPSYNQSMSILGKVRPDNEIMLADEFVKLGEEKSKFENIAEGREEKDSIAISAIKKEPLQIEYLNILQKIENISISKFEKPENEIEFGDAFEINSIKQWTTGPF